MRVILHCGVFAALLLSLAWAAPQGTDDHEGHDHGPHTAEHHHHFHHGEDEPHPQHEGQHNYILSPPNADFAYALYKKLIAMPEFKSKNIFFSPLSISMALSMLALGAKGETFSQLYMGLGYPRLPAATVNEAYEHILHMLGHNQEHMQLDVSNAVAVMEGAKVVDKFLEDAKHYYESEAISVDFSKPEIAVEEINKYIAKNTNNTITDMVKEVDPSTMMMLINCVYFRGEWMEYFDLDGTKTGDFQVDANTKVSVDMMQNRGFYEYYEDTENFTTVLRLPYKGSASMIIVMPDEGKMKEVEDGISRHRVRHWMQSLKSDSLIVQMPKYNISVKLSLRDTLESMGVVSPFSDTADFTGMTDQKVKVSKEVPHFTSANISSMVKNMVMEIVNKRLSVSHTSSNIAIGFSQCKVEHQAVLKVDEKGTEAAAATTVEIVLMSAPIQPKIVKIDRPFFVFIADFSTRSILFMGKILNPAAM